MVEQARWVTSAEEDGSACSIRLPATPSTARKAREFVARTCARWSLAPETVESALLLVSELVTNAVRYGRGIVTVTAEQSSTSLLRVSVHDEDTTSVPTRRASELLDEGGRGLLLVDLLAARWGVEPHPFVGKDVWFGLAL